MKFAKAFAHNPQGSDHSHGRSVFPLTGGGLWDNVGFRSTGPRSNLSAVEAPTMSRFVRFFSLFFLAGFLALLTFSSAAQNVTTWHNDNNRTGLQPNETTLTPTSVGATAAFGLLWQYANTSNGGSIAGEVYAQPLAMQGLSGVGNGCQPSCDSVFIPTEQDMLYAFNADSSSQPPLWSANLASNAIGYVDCSTHNPPCPQDLIYPDIGVTGTPVISTSANANPNILYVVSAVLLGAYPWDVQYFLHAIDIKTGLEKTGSPQQIIASATGVAPLSSCMTASGSGTIMFDPQHHLQRDG